VLKKVRAKEWHTTATKSLHKTITPLPDHHITSSQCHQITPSADHPSPHPKQCLFTGKKGRFTENTIIYLNFTILPIRLGNNKVKNIEIPPFLVIKMPLNCLNRMDNRVHSSGKIPE